LKDGGLISAISSNAWLGKEYGIQFKRFLLDNFTVKYVVKSNAEHWFKDSKVSTIFTTIQKGNSENSTRFITINSKLELLTSGMNEVEIIDFFRELYSEIDNCELEGNTSWKLDSQFENVYHKSDGTIKVSIVSKQHLINQIDTQENWNTNFTAENPLQQFQDSLINPYPDLIDSGRGTRTPWDKMFILSIDNATKSKIEEEFLIPIIQNSKNIGKIKHTEKSEKVLFVCHKSLEELKANYPNSYNYIKKWESHPNKVGISLEKANRNVKPYWYSVKKEFADILPQININQRAFTPYSPTPVFVNQRLVYIKTRDKNDVVLISALLNSVLSVLNIEFNGIPRFLGSLDLNAH
jgi:hypothetical protein